MAIPPCQGSVREGAGGKCNLAPFQTGADLKDQLRLLEPLQEGNNSTSSLKALGLQLTKSLYKHSLERIGASTIEGGTLVPLPLVSVEVNCPKAAVTTAFTAA